MKNQSFRIFGSVLQVIALSLLGTTAVEDAFGSDTNMVVAWGAGTTNSGLSPHYGQSIVPSNLTEVVAIAGGGYYSLALRSDGTVVGWGQNNYGQINVPPGLTNVMAIAAGNSHSLALKDDGTVVAWGQNSYGQTNIPPGLENVVAIASGEGHNLALRGDGTVTAWGWNDSGQTNVPPGLANVVAIAGGRAHSLALKGDGTVVAWGRNDYGQTNVPPDLTNVVAISVCWHHSLVLKGDGTVVAWGAGTTNSGSSPQLGQSIVPGGLTNVVAIATGDYHSLALRGDGTVVAWGAGTTNSGKSQHYGQSIVPTHLTDVAAIAAGDYHSLALVNDGLPLVMPPVKRMTYSGMPVVFNVTAAGAPPLSYQWQFNGTNIAGATRAWLTLTNVQLADAGNYCVVVSNAWGTTISTNTMLTVCDSPPIILGQPENEAVPLEYHATFTAAVAGSRPFGYQWQFNGTNISGATNGSLTLTNIQPADAGNYRVVVSNTYGTAISSNATLTLVPSIVVAWGWDYYGQTDVPRGLPDAVAVAAGYYHSLALRSDGMVVAWGAGTNSHLAPYYGQSVVPGSLTNVVAIAAGDHHSLALKGDGTVLAWGAGTTNTGRAWDCGQSIVPGSLTNVVAIAAGSYHSLALKGDGMVVAWGAGTTNFGSTPNHGQSIVPDGLTNVVAVAGGGQHSLALKGDGTVVAWGWNCNGQTNVPPDLTNVVAIAGGGYHSLALKGDGTVVAWGRNDYGQTNVPPDLTNVVAIAGGYMHSLALRGDSTVVAWGFNVRGQTNVPPGLANVVAIAAGGYHSLAIDPNWTVTVEPPTVAAQPTGCTNDAGTTATLFVNVNGSPLLNYQWVKDGTNYLTDGGNVSGATTDTLILTNLGRRDSGSYAVLVANVYNSVISSNATLVVRAPQRLGTLALLPDGTCVITSRDEDGGLLSTNDLPNFEVYAGTNLVDWILLTNDLTLTNGQLWLHDTGSTNFLLRFYRIIER
jgi:alpha-tubulin suppressor-like RCC1 family protein